jgi:hypothetical protein
VSGSINVDGVEGGSAGAAAAPWFDWKFDYREFSQIYPVLAEQPEPPQEPRAAPKADVPTLEADIAALVTAAADNLRQSSETPPRPRQMPLQAPQLRVVPPSHGEDFSLNQTKNVSVKVNEFRPRERAWIDIRPGDAVRMVTSGGGLRTRPKLRAMVALTLGLAIGWVAVLPLSYFRTYLARAVDEPPALAQVPRNDRAAARPQVSADIRRDATNATSTASKGPNHGRRLAQNATPPKPIKTSLAGLPSVDVTASDSARRSDPGARPMPFPESKPETLSGWTVREVYGSTAILDGPERSFKAARGDIVPGVGRLESIVRWGDRWIVATESGLISSP